MIYGICVSSVLILIFWYITNESVTASQFKRKHPIVSIILVFAGIYLVMNMLDSMLVFFLGILLPFSGKSQCDKKNENHTKTNFQPVSFIHL